MNLLFIRYVLPAMLVLSSLQALAAGAEDIRFRTGEITGGVSGTVTDRIKTWQFRARKDQQVTATLVPAGGDKGMLTMTLYSYCGEEYGIPLLPDGLRWQGRLPCNGRYTVDVAPGVDAMREKRVQHYSLTLDIR